jgi:hypothetical protein
MRLVPMPSPPVEMIRVYDAALLQTFGANAGIRAPHEVSRLSFTPTCAHGTVPVPIAWKLRVRMVHEQRAEISA